MGKPFASVCELAECEIVKLLFLSNLKQILLEIFKITFGFYHPEDFDIVHKYGQLTAHTSCHVSHP